MAGTPDPRGASCRHRIFIAVALDPEIRRAAAEARVHFARHAHRFRWVAPDHMHLTLRFLGEITEAQLTRAVDAAGEAAGGVAPFAVTLGGVGGFPSLRAPRVLWVGVREGADALRALAAALNRALAARKIHAEGRPFQPHLTLARARSLGRPPDLVESSDAPGDVALGSQRVEEVAVIESVPGPSGHSYRDVARQALGG